MASYYFYPYVALTGGTDGCLDSLDGSLLKDGDGAIVIVPATQAYYAYTLDDDSGADESSPDVIKPDSNAGTKRWIRTNADVDSRATKVVGGTTGNYPKLKSDGDIEDSGVAAGDCTKIATRTVATTAPNTNQLIGYSGTQWEPRGYGITYAGTEVFSGTSPDAAWTDLDISAVVGANRAYAVLRYYTNGGSPRVFFRTNGSSLEQSYATYGGGLTGCLNESGHESFLMVLTDTSGVIEWYTTSACTGSTVNVIAYVRL